MVLLKRYSFSKSVWLVVSRVSMDQNISCVHCYMSKLHIPIWDLKLFSFCVQFWNKTLLGVLLNTLFGSLSDCYQNARKCLQQIKGILRCVLLQISLQETCHTTRLTADFCIQCQQELWVLFRKWKISGPWGFFLLGCRWCAPF